MQWLWKMTTWLGRFWRLSLPTPTSAETSARQRTSTSPELQLLNRALAEAVAGRDRLRELATERRARLATLEERLAEADESAGAELALCHEAVQRELAELDRNLVTAESQAELLRAERETLLASANR